VTAPLRWQLATVRSITTETPRTKTFTLTLPAWVMQQPGQHYDVRLTAPDGYQAQRSYSIASEPERRGEIDLTVERISDGEVSPYLHDVLAVGDQLEVRGPIGGYFVWTENVGGPLLLIGGGSGVVPLMSMIRHRIAVGSQVRTRLLLSARTIDDIIYRPQLEELSSKQRGIDVIFTLTRQTPAEWTGYRRRIDDPMLREALAPLGDASRIYVCGPTLLVEAAANSLVRLGLPADQIRTERFGPSGT
jgi:ferredoxin-NADP reductase